MFRHLNSLLSDINECTANVHNCDANAFCNNTEGSYKCTCSSGYDGNGISCTGKLLWPIDFSQKKKQCMYFNSLIFFISFHFKFSFSFHVLLLFLFLLFWGVGELKIVWAAVFELCFVKSHYGSWFRWSVLPASSLILS